MSKLSLGISGVPVLVCVNEKLVAVQRGIEAGFKFVLGLGRGRAQLENLQWAELRKQFDQETR